MLLCHWCFCEIECIRISDLQYFPIRRKLGWVLKYSTKNIYFQKLFLLTLDVSMHLILMFWNVFRLVFALHNSSLRPRGAGPVGVGWGRSPKSWKNPGKSLSWLLHLFSYYDIVWEMARIDISVNDFSRLLPFSYLPLPPPTISSPNLTIAERENTGKHFKTLK